MKREKMWSRGNCAFKLATWMCTKSTRILFLLVSCWLVDFEGVSFQEIKADRYNVFSHLSSDFSSTPVFVLCWRSTIHIYSCVNMGRERKLIYCKLLFVIN